MTTFSNARRAATRAAPLLAFSAFFATVMGAFVFVALHVPL